MRTTLDIDDDVLHAAKELARAEGKTAGQVISELARQALTAPSSQSQYGQPGLAEEATMFTNVWPTLPNRQGVLVTSELVRSIQDELDLEDGEVKDFSQEAPAAAPAETVAGKNPSGKNTGRRNLGSKG